MYNKERNKKIEKYFFFSNEYVYYECIRGAIIVTKCLRGSHQGFIVSTEVCDITHSEKIKDRYSPLHQLVNRT